MTFKKERFLWGGTYGSVIYLKFYGSNANFWQCKTVEILVCLARVHRETIFSRNSQNSRKSTAPPSTSITEWRSLRKLFTQKRTSSWLRTIETYLRRCFKKHKCVKLKSRMKKLQSVEICERLEGGLLLICVQCDNVDIDITIYHTIFRL